VVEEEGAKGHKVIEMFTLVPSAGSLIQNLRLEDSLLKNPGSCVSSTQRRPRPARSRIHTTLSRQIAIGIAAGVALGLLVGERAAPLEVAADAYVRLLQMTVLPYVVVSLVAGLGSLSIERATVIARRVSLILVLLWALSIALAFLLPLSFPRWQTASFFSTSDYQRPEGFDFLGLYIPTNPFNALANNVVPAVVLFSILIGVTLIRVSSKEQLLGPLQALGKAIGEVNHLVMKLAPYGLFATAASLAATMRPEELQRVEVFLISYTAVALLLMAWVLPGLVEAVTPARYREVMAPAKDALLTAAMTGSLFAVLPTLGEVARGVLRRHAPENPEAVEAPDVIVPASFTFPHAAKLLSLSFIPFAAWYAESPLHLDDYLRLAGAGLLSFFGSLNAAVPFLLDLFHLPQDAFHLFLATNVVNARIGSAVAAMHTLTLAVLGGFAIAGELRVDRARVLRYLAITAGLSVATIGGLRLLFQHAMVQQYSRDKVLASMERIRTGVPVTVHRESVRPPSEPAGGSPGPHRGPQATARGLSCGQPAVFVLQRGGGARGVRRRDGARARPRAEGGAGARAGAGARIRRRPGPAAGDGGRLRALLRRDHVGGRGHGGAGGPPDVDLSLLRRTHGLPGERPRSGALRVQRRPAPRGARPRGRAPRLDAVRAPARVRAGHRDPDLRGHRGLQALPRRRPRGARRPAPPRGARRGLVLALSRSGRGRA
jgi:Na+/H+-dicarboxylate symporter